MKIVIRLDANSAIGAGHLSRCLTLAKALGPRAEATFVTRRLPAELARTITAQGHEWIDLEGRMDDGRRPAASTSFGPDGRPSIAARDEALRSPSDREPDWRWELDAIDRRLKTSTLDWLVVDHYGLDHRFESGMRDRVRRVLVVDDLADRIHDCDVLVDPTVGARPERYDGKLPDGCLRLVGARYALLRPEFAAARPANLERRREPALRRLLVAFGGADSSDYTRRVLEALARSPLAADVEVVAIVGALYRNVEQLERVAAAMPVRTIVRRDVRDMSEELSRADLAIGAIGTNALERCCLGLPSLVFPIAENQQETAEALEKRGAVRRVELEELPEAVGRLTLRDIDELGMGARAVTDGRGAERVATTIGDRSICFFGSDLATAEAVGRCARLSRIVVEASRLSKELATHAFLGDVPVHRVSGRADLEALEPEESLGISCGFGLIFRKTVIDRFADGIVNIHFGRLPEIRGRHPVSWAFLLNHRSVGVSFHLVDERIDVGLLLHEFEVDRALDDDIATVNARIVDRLATELPRALDALDRRDWTELDEGDYYESLAGALDQIDPAEHDAKYVLNAIRSQAAYGGIEIGGRRVVEGYVFDEAFASDSYAVIETRDGVRLMVR